MQFKLTPLLTPTSGAAANAEIDATVECMLADHMPGHTEIAMFVFAGRSLAFHKAERYRTKETDQDDRDLILRTVTDCARHDNRMVTRWLSPQQCRIRDRDNPPVFAYPCVGVTDAGIVVLRKHHEFSATRQLRAL